MPAAGTRLVPRQLSSTQQPVVGASSRRGPLHLKANRGTLLLFREVPSHRGCPSEVATRESTSAENHKPQGWAASTSSPSTRAAQTHSADKDLPRKKRPLCVFHHPAGQREPRSARPRWNLLRTAVRQQTACGAGVIPRFATLAAGKGSAGVLGQLLDQEGAAISDVPSLRLTAALELSERTWVTRNARASAKNCSRDTFCYIRGYLML